MPPHHFLPTIFLVMVSLTSVSQADLIITSIEGNTHRADGYSTFATTSSDMVGMQVTVTFRNGSTDTQVWGIDGASGNGWKMTQGPGSTFSNPFILTNTGRTRITRFTMRGAGSSTIFDRSTANSTAGTANGRDLEELTSLSNSQDVLVTYFDQVKTTGGAPVGDIFASMDVQFSRGINRSNGEFIFVTDTDTTINDVVIAIPEPGAALALTLFSLGYALPRRRTSAGIR